MNQARQPGALVHRFPFGDLGLTTLVQVGSASCATSADGLVACVRTATGLTVLVEAWKAQ
jgi:hypothetical protein